MLENISVYFSYCVFHVGWGGGNLNPTKLLKYPGRARRGWNMEHEIFTTSS